MFKYNSREMNKRELWEDEVRPRVEKAALLLPGAELLSPKDQLEATVKNLSAYISEPGQPIRISAFRDVLDVRECLAEYPRLKNFSYDPATGPKVKPSPFDAHPADVEADNLANVLKSITTKMTTVDGYAHVFDHLNKNANSVRHWIKLLHQSEKDPYTETQIQREVFTVLNAVNRRVLIADKNATKILVAGVPVNLAEPGKVNTTKVDLANQISTDVLSDLESGQNAYDLVPKKYRGAIDFLVNENYKGWEGKFPGKEAFKEAMAKNWLAKYRVFGMMTRQAGFVEAKPYPEEQQDTFNHSLIACLTANSSIVVIGSGAFEKTGPGASFEYRKLPLRTESKLRNISLGQSARLDHRPRLDERLTIFYDSVNGKRKFNTSSLIAVYRRDDTPDSRVKLQNFLETINFANTTVNLLTGFNGNEDIKK